MSRRTTSSATNSKHCLRHPSLEEGAGKRCSECASATTTHWMNGVCEFSCDQPPVPLVVGLNLFNTELSPERYRRGQRSQEVGEEEDWVVAGTEIPGSGRRGRLGCGGDRDPRKWGKRKTGLWRGQRPQEVGEEEDWVVAGTETSGGGGRGRLGCGGDRDLRRWGKRKTGLWRSNVSFLITLQSQDVFESLTL